MCGIAGILSCNGAHTPERDLIEAMNATLVHRGPDQGDVFLDEGIALGSRRLSIIDLAAGPQPLSNEDGTVWITYNGEIYNHASLREDLVARGHTFKTLTDTEVIVHLYEEMGERCVERLQGMFAFGIWDKRSRTLLLARDRLGIKPLYYYEGSNFLAFASGIRALLTLDVPRRLNAQALHDYLTFHYTVAPDTMIDAVRKLEPGHVLVAQNGKVNKRRYWALDYSRKPALPEEECIDAFAERFREVTERHMVADVPLGVLLSGGLDSTAVTAVVSQLAGRQVKTFSVAFADDGEAYDERRYAQLVARHYGTDHHEIAITRQDFVNALPHYIYALEEPMADAASVPLYFVAKLAREHVTVVLSGEGSDELLGGYFRTSDFRGAARAQWVRRIPRLLRRGVIGPINDRVLASRRIHRYLELADRPPGDYFQVSPMYMGANVFSEEAKREFYGPSMRGLSLRPSEAIVVDAYRRASRLDLVDQLLSVYTEQWLPDDLLLKADKMTMAHSLELRVPFLDHTFVEFVASLPVNLKLRSNGNGSLITKYALRRAFEHSMPSEIMNRPKLGFPVPLPSLFRHELKPLARDVFASRVVKESGLFNPSRLQAALDQGETDINHWGRLWRVLVFCLWQEAFKVA